MAGPALGESLMHCFLSYHCCEGKLPSQQPAEPALSVVEGRLYKNLYLVRFFWQAGNANAGVALVTNIEADQQRGDLFQDARVLQLSAINGAHARNFCRQRSYCHGRVGVVAADYDVAVDGSVSVQYICRRIVERGYHRHARRHEFGGLLCRGAFPEAKSASGSAADAGGKGHSGVNHDAAFRDCRLDLLRSEE